MANRKLKCCGCKSRFDSETMIRLPGGNFHSLDCATEYAQDKSQRARERKAAKEARQHREERKAARGALRELNRNDLRWQHKKTQTVFNRMRVLQELLWFKDRGLDPTCISCGKKIGNDIWCCGHFKTRGARPGLRYDLKNTYLQHNRHCNMELSGDIYGTGKTHGYVEGLKIRFGQEEGQAIIDYCDTTTGVEKWTCDQLEAMRKEFNAEIRRLEALL